MENENATVNSVIEELSRINKAAGTYAANMEEAKKKLERDYRDQREDFDLQLNDEAQERLAKLKQQLTEANDEKIARLKTDSEEYMAGIEKAFEENHSQWAEEIAQRILSER